MIFQKSKIIDQSFLFRSNLISRPSNLSSAHRFTPHIVFALKFQFFVDQNLDCVLGIRHRIISVRPLSAQAQTFALTVPNVSFTIIININWNKVTFHSWKLKRHFHFVFQIHCIDFNLFLRFTPHRHKWSWLYRHGVFAEFAATNAVGDGRRKISATWFQWNFIQNRIECFLYAKWKIWKFEILILN